MKHIKEKEALMNKEPKYVNISKTVSRNLDNIIYDPKMASSGSSKMINDINERI